MISVIVPAKDAADTLGECLNTLLNQDCMQYEHDYEVIVVDDGSTDETATIAESYGVHVIRQANAGPAAARNAGVKIARGEIIVFTDADCAPSNNWLATLTQPFHDTDVVGVKGAYLTHQRGLIPRFVQLEYEFKYTRMRKLPAIDFIDTFSAGYRKEIFLQNAGFDESIRRPSAEDAEFSFRLARKGYRMIFEPKATVFHRHDRNLSEYVYRKFEIGYWKALMLQWIPEKIFSDSHAAPTQRAEILLSAALVLSIVCIPIWPIYATLALLVSAVIFLLLTSPFQIFIAKKDPQVLWIASGMLVARASSLGMGLLKGLIMPPKIGPRGLPSQGMITRTAKRIIDIIGASTGLVVSAPLIAGAAVAIRLDSRGPILFEQTRVGEFGKTFTIFKLRTMVEGADKMALDMMSMNCLKGPVFKIPNDPRVTRVGRVLRRWSLDELPQFWNVLKGDMSLVGPRPEIPHFVERYTDEQRQRLMVKPGLTGPVQVNGRGGLDFDERFQLELEYLRNYSFREDLKILLRTFSAILAGEGTA